MPTVKKQTDAATDKRGIFDLGRLPNPALAVLMTFGGAIVILCIAHLTGHFRNFIPEDPGSAIVGVVTGLLLLSRCGWLIVERSAEAAAEASRSVTIGATKDGMSRH
jgi:hypothetical protein